MAYTNLELFGIFLIVASVALIMYFTMKKESMDEVAAPEVTTPEQEVVAPAEPSHENAPATAPVEEAKEITPADLLPNQAEVQDFEKTFPQGEGDAKDKNFLIAGYNIGVNTVGSSLKNANLQLRSDPYIPRQDTLWNNSSIMSSDLTNRKELQIGSSA